MKKSVLLILAILGFIVPNIFTFIETVENGNILLWSQPFDTVSAVFASPINSAFALDLLVVTLVFFVWSYHEAKRYKVKRVWLFWILSLAFGLSGPFPLFLYAIEEKRGTKRRKRKGPKKVDMVGK